MKQIRLTGAVTPKYQDDERYPGKLMVAMEDGRVLHYVLRDERTSGAFIEAMDILQGWPLFGGRRFRMGQKRPPDCDGSPTVREGTM